MNKRIPAIISSISNTFCDFYLDIAVNRYNLYVVLLATSILSFLFQAIMAIGMGINLTKQALPIVFIYGLIILLGYLFYVQALKRIPIGLAGMLENFDLFLVLIIDINLGY